MAVENQSSAASINVLRRMTLPVERERIAVTFVSPRPEAENLCLHRVERESRSLLSARVEGDGVRLTSAVALIASSSALSLGVYVSSMHPLSGRALFALLNTTARALLDCLHRHGHLRMVESSCHQDRFHRSFETAFCVAKQRGTIIPSFPT